MGFSSHFQSATAVKEVEQRCIPLPVSILNTELDLESFRRTNLHRLQYFEYYSESVVYGWNVEGGHPFRSDFEL